MFGDFRRSGLKTHFLLSDSQNGVAAGAGPELHVPRSIAIGRRYGDVGIDLFKVTKLGGGGAID